MPTSSSRRGDTRSADAASTAPLAAVERAVAELRRGGIVLIRDADGSAGLALAAAKSCGDSILARVRGLAGDAPVLVTTRRRAEAVGIEIPPHIAGGMGAANKPMTLDLPTGVPVDVILRPTTPTSAPMPRRAICRGRSPAMRRRSPRPRSSLPSWRG